MASDRERERPPACGICGTPLSFRDRLLGRRECPADRGPAARERRQARARYLGAITGFDMTMDLAPREERILAEITPESIGPDWHRRVATSAVLFLLDQALADSVLTADEDARIAKAAQLAQIGLPGVIRSRPGLAAHIIVARANDGRLPLVSKPSVRLRRREICYFESRSDVLTGAAGEVSTNRSGVSTAKGTIVDSGRLEKLLPRSDPNLRAWDTGVMVITDQRLFFEGEHLTIQVPHRRLIGFTLFRDAVRVRIAGRHAEPILSVREPFVVAAIANGAWQQNASEPLPRVYSVDSFDDWPVIQANSVRSK